jgi:transposase InsO family protein
MPWKEVTLVEERLKFVLKAFKSKENFTEQCRRFGISTKTGYKWLKRFEEGGVAGLKDQPTIAKDVRNKTDDKTLRRIVRLKKRYKSWGAKKIHALYIKKYPDEYVPCRTTIEAILKREGFTKKKRRKAVYAQVNPLRIKAVKPNALWTVDFKGWWWTSKKERCEPLTIRDDYSKYILAIEVPEKGNITCVKGVFDALFRKYGLPEHIRSDNGPPFGNVLNMWGFTKLTVWWISLGIKIDRSAPGHPEQNGSHERMHRDIKKELQNKVFGDLKQHQKMFDKWKKEFNEVRPHEALGMKTPKECYMKSERKYWGSDVEVDYHYKMKSRMVNDRGFFNWRTKRIFVGNPFSGYYVGVNECSEKWTEVWFEDLKLGEINPDTLQIEVNTVDCNAWSFGKSVT